MRLFLYPPLLAACLVLCACSAIKQENEDFLGAPPIAPRTLMFNYPSPGFIRSPYAPDEGLVDVRGYKPGTLVRCPYTGRTFVVPPRDLQR